MARKILLKENGLSGSESTPSGYRYIGYDNTTPSQKSGATVSSLGGGLSYKVYTALLTQSGTASPVATVLENTLSGSVVWTRNAVGEYFGTLTGEFTSNKTVVFMQVGGGGGATWGFQFIAARLDDDRVYVVTQIGNSTSDYSDDLLASSSIEIRVYP